MDLCEATASAVVWAHHEFGSADFGDKRLTTRIQTMAGAMAENPAGKATDVFRTAAELEAAYRFVNNERVTAKVICEAMCEGMLRRCAGESFVYIALDGSSLKLTDHMRKKNFGAVGAYSKGARGLQVMAALGVNQQGVTLGLASLDLRVRGNKKTIPHKDRTLEHKETRYWAAAIDETIVRFSKEQNAPIAWFQLDREGDAAPLLQDLSSSSHWFTVRANNKRRIATPGKKTQYVLDALARPKAHVGSYMLEIPGGEKRTARTARMSVYAAKVTLLLRKTPTGKTFTQLPIHVIRVLETSAVPAGEKAIEWVLYTNHSIDTPEDIALVIQSTLARRGVFPNLENDRLRCRIYATSFNGKSKDLGHYACCREHSNRTSQTTRSHTAKSAGND
jgi:Transposase DNA-binding